MTRPTVLQDDEHRFSGDIVGWVSTWLVHYTQRQSLDEWLSLGDPIDWEMMDDDPSRNPKG